jgi:hypothetical protein
MSARVVGWREWVTLPALGIDRIEAKVDTGARTSTLHATTIEGFRRHGREWVRFLPPGADRAVELAPSDRRDVRSSTGHTQSRYVIETPLVIGTIETIVELTLTDRSRMRYPMLIGRTALAGRFLVDPSRVYLAGG